MDHSSSFTLMLWRHCIPINPIDGLIQSSGIHRGSQAALKRSKGGGGGVAATSARSGGDMVPVFFPSPAIAVHGNAISSSGFKLSFTTSTRLR
jgi:hypothetical protein